MFGGFPRSPSQPFWSLAIDTLAFAELLPTPSQRALIFDCDGTLTNSMPVHYQAWKAALEPHGIEFSEARFYQLAGKPTEKIIHLLAEEQGIEVDVRQVAWEKEEAFYARMDGLQPQAAVLQVAQRYRGELPMAVASGGNRVGIERQLQVIGCADWFDVVVTAEDTQRHKPDPDVFLEAAKRLGASPAECLVYEDADLGIEAARRAGMSVIDVRRST